MKLSAFTLLSTAVPLLACNVWLQSLVEIESAQYGINNRHYDKNDGGDGKECKRSTSREICLLLRRRIHSDQLEEEVGKTAKI